MPVNLDASEGFGAVDLALACDTTRLVVLSDADVRPSSLTADCDFLQVNLDSTAGTIRAGMASLRTEGLLDRGAGSMLEITFRIKDDAPD